MVAPTRLRLRGRGGRISPLTADQLPADFCRLATGPRDRLEAREALEGDARGDMGGNLAATRAREGEPRSAPGLPSASAIPMLKSAAYLSPLRSADLAAARL